MAFPLKIFLAFLSALLGLHCGRFPPPAPVTTRSEAHERFLTICREESGLNPVTRQMPRTLYIYLPLEESIYQHVASKQGAQSSDTPQEKRIIYYLETRFENDRFIITYDIGAARSYPSSPGYDTNYTEAFNTRKRALLTALFRAFGDLDREGGASAQLFDFVVLIIADISQGLRNRELFGFEDYLRVMTQTMPEEEFAKRYMNDGMSGDARIIGDKAGAHIDYQDFSWGEFLAKQITRRIEFQYSQSDFPPKGELAEDIRAIAQQAIDAYGFQDFTGIDLVDKRDGE